MTWDTVIPPPIFANNQKIKKGESSAKENTFLCISVYVPSKQTHMYLTTAGNKNIHCNISLSN